MELLERFSRGDVDAFEELFKRHQSDAYQWICRIVRDPATAEELTVEAFWRAHRAHARFRPDGNFAAWLRRIATNVALNHLNGARRDPSLVADPPADPPQHDRNDPELQERIAAAFVRLSPKLRIVAILSLVEEVPHREIASALGISESALRVRLFRATKLLRHHLQDLRVSHERAR